MSNTKSKIIVGASLIAIGGMITYVIATAIRKKNVLDRIYTKLDDTKTSEGLSATLLEDEKHKAHFGFDTNFWKNGKNGITPDPKLLFAPVEARAIAREIKKSIGTFSEDEDAIMGFVKKLKSQGQLSQVADAYQSAPLSYGNLADDLQSALKSTWYGSKDRLTELNTVINQLPY